MKNIKEINQSNLPIVTKNKTLNEEAQTVLFPEKLALANHILNKFPLPEGINRQTR